LARHAALSIRAWSRDPTKVRILLGRSSGEQASPDGPNVQTGTGWLVSQGRRIFTFVFAAAMVAAPFLALLYDLTAGLAVLTVALAATAYLAIDAAREAEPILRRRLRILGGVNAALGLIALGLLAARLANLL
jgi:VIT1/CCC1 family predicted Fe2+/Mn2+ transporter